MLPSLINVFDDFNGNVGHPNSIQRHEQVTNCNVRPTSKHIIVLTTFPCSIYARGPTFTLYIVIGNKLVMERPWDFI